MRLNLRKIIPAPGASIPFDFQMDLSDLEWNGERPAAHPIHVSGTVRNMAGALLLEGEADTVLELRCDRCLKPFSRETRIPLEALLATELADEENEDDIVLLDGDEVDVGEIARTAFILAMDTKHLCSEDCKGLCAKCGANLNNGPCGCKPEVDPRLAKLAQLLDQPE
ncbi:MAG: DUF177 domain-containing protein [Pseudoflavonifractor capillosus]|uniref:DUF177 domain-containing protein n=1 Tax=Pseudoflavonifractor intestinihominis TaxID=3133171 RepID=A0ABV1E8E2_9FIRM|nr:DUF177 domain-containing protein [Pseudoflavonifractor capillosus]MCI5928484.1 DUF177 domain-containing protein [Pseudoflavonifractor capillosus]MDY4661392.1 DUF177 domain-containing protein [Pseudoflavonifractor capillosus]